MEICPIAYFRSPLTSKFGIPRQSGLVNELAGRVIMEPEYRHADAFRGLEHFDYVWLIWEFSANSDTRKNLTVRPPRLGGNRRMGVFATRSPFRPNNLGLSCVRIDRVEEEPGLGPVIHVLGADLMDGTPIYDIKPYVAYADCHPEACCGFVDEQEWQELEVEIPESLQAVLTPSELTSLERLLALDPRPSYHDDATRVYGMPFAGHDVHFQVVGQKLKVLDF